MCRRHLAATTALSPRDAHVVADQLRDIATRLRALTNSMTASGRPADTDENASWIEALRWFAGWRVPLTLTAPGCASDQRPE
ncbi:MAG: hypothetical protein ACR2LI_15640 [Propionibacteriaceae bacterium]